MTKTFFPVLVLLLVCSLLLSACNQNSIALIDAIVSSAEILLPAIPNLSASDAAAITSYLDPALSITNNLLSNDASQDSIAQAVNDFNRLIVPKLSPTAPPAANNLVFALGKAVSNFLSAYRGASVSSNLNTALSAFAEPDKRKAPPKIELSARDKKKAAALKKRVEAARAKLRKK